MVKLILYIVVGLLVLSFFGVSLQHLIESPTTQANFSFIGDLLKQGWDQIATIIVNAWNSIQFWKK